MELAEEVVELAVGILLARASSKGAAQRRRDPGLVGQAVNMDDSPVHVILCRLLLGFFICHSKDLTQRSVPGFAIGPNRAQLFDGCERKATTGVRARRSIFAVPA